MIDKFYYVKGGAERYMFELAEILKENGHTVIPFSMQSPNNLKTPYEKYFVSYLDFHSKSKKEALLIGLRSLSRIFYSLEAQRKLQRLIAETRPDIAHLHMIDHQISPSILPVLRTFKIPVVQTVHTFKLVCPTYRLYHMGKGKICEKCLHGAYWRALLEKCHKNSFFATLLVVLEMYFHKLLQIYERGIDRFLVPSRFMGQKLIEGKIPKQKIQHLFYTIQVHQYPYHSNTEPYFIYYGRLSEEKGIMTLLRAMEGGGGLPLRIVGDGPQRGPLEAYVRERGIPNVYFEGNLDGKALFRKVSHARFVVVPSEWYENSPLVVYESFAMGKPVIGAHIGGIPELITHGKDGFLFPPGDVQVLRQWILHLSSHPEILPRMGKCAREKAEREFSPQSHYKILIEIYKELLDSQKASLNSTKG